MEPIQAKNTVHIEQTLNQESSLTPLDSKISKVSKECIEALNEAIDYIVELNETTPKSLLHQAGSPEECIEAVCKATSYCAQDPSLQITIEEHELIERLKELAKRDGKGVSEQIKNSGITHEPSLIEIAKIAAAQNGRGVSRSIQNYGIKNEEALAEIAEIAAAQSGRGVCEYLDLYKIQNPYLLAKVLKTATLYFGLDAIYNAYKFSKESLALLEPEECSRLVLSAFAFSLFEMKKDEFKPFYRMFSQYLLNNTPIEKRADPMDLFHKCLDQQKTIIFTGSTFDDTFGKIFKLRNKKQAALLLGILIQEGHEPKYEKVYKYLTEDIIPRLLPSIIPAKWASHTFKSPNISNLVTFFSKHHRKIKDQTSSIFSTFLLATESLEFLREIPFEKKIETLEKICSQTELNDIDESLKLITYFAIKKDVDLIKELPFERPFIELTQAFQDMLYETLPAPSSSSSSSFDPIKRYFETFGLMRISYALEIYQGTLRNEEPVVQETLHRFIQSVLTNTFFEERHRTDNNPHLHAIQEFAPVVLEKWKHLSLIHETSEETVMLTQYWQDLFLSGTEITGSCQRIDASAYESKCLLAYCLDGKNSMIAVKDPSGKILARSMLRLLWNPMNERPALFLDTLYPSNCSLERKNAILSAAQECARQLGCQLFEYTSKKGEILESLGSSCPYEYADNAGGVTEGKFSISAKPITLML